MDSIGLFEVVLIILSLGGVLFIPAVLIAILFQLKKLNDKTPDSNRDSTPDSREQHTGDTREPL